MVVTIFFRTLEYLLFKKNCLLRDVACIASTCACIKEGVSPALGFFTKLVGQKLRTLLTIMAFEISVPNNLDNQVEIFFFNFVISISDACYLV